MRRNLAYLLIALLSVAATACGGTSGPLPNPDGGLGAPHDGSPPLGAHDAPAGQDAAHMDGGIHDAPSLIDAGPF